jgi:hypothetical protein
VAIRDFHRQRGLPATLSIARDLSRVIDSYPQKNNQDDNDNDDNDEGAAVITASVKSHW